MRRDQPPTENTPALPDWAKELPPEDAAVVAAQKWDSPAAVVAAYRKTSSSAKPWTEGLTPEQLAFAESRGWKGPLDAVNAHDALMKLKGAPADELVRIPKSGLSPEDRAALHKRLGVPEDEKGYAFDDVEIPEALAPVVQAFTKDVARKIGLTPADAKELVGWFIGQNTAAAEQAAAQFEEQKNAAHEKVRGEWGTAYDANLQAANHAAKALGLADEEVDALTVAMGGEKFLQRMAELGEKLREYKVVEPEKPGSGGTTRAAAVARMGEIRANPVYWDANNPARKALVEEYAKLSSIVHGDTPVAASGQSVAL